MAIWLQSPGSQLLLMAQLKDTSLREADCVSLGTPKRFLTLVVVFLKIGLIFLATIHWKPLLKHLGSVGHRFHSRICPTGCVTLNKLLSLSGLWFLHL